MKRNNTLYDKIYLSGIFFFLFTVQTVAAQKKATSTYDKSISLITENDSYLLNGSDRYYTNGLFLQLRTAQTKKSKKNIQQFELGQMIFTPKRKFEMRDLVSYNNLYPTNTIDRPFCGYLFAKYSNDRFVSPFKMVRLGISAGTIGKASGGEQTQKLIHKIAGFYIPVGWEYQVQHNFLFNFQAAFTQQLVDKKIDDAQFRVIPTAEVNLGNTFTNARLLCMLAFGVIDNFANSALYNAEIYSQENMLKKKYELFFYVQPQVTLQGYNATLQGDLYSKIENEALTAEPELFLYQHKIGAVYSRQRISLNVGYVFQTKELKTQKLDHQFGSVQISYKFN